MVLQLKLLFWLIFSRVVYIYVQLDMFEELYLRVFVFGVSFLCLLRCSTRMKLFCKLSIFLLNIYMLQYDISSH